MMPVSEESNCLKIYLRPRPARRGFQPPLGEQPWRRKSRDSTPVKQHSGGGRQPAPSGAPACVLCVAQPTVRPLVGRLGDAGSFFCPSLRQRAAWSCHTWAAAASVEPTPGGDGGWRGGVKGSGTFRRRERAGRTERMRRCCRPRPASLPVLHVVSQFVLATRRYSGTS